MKSTFDNRNSSHCTLKIDSEKFLTWHISRIKRGGILLCVRQTRVSNEATTGPGNSNAGLCAKFNRQGSSQARTFCAKTCFKTILKSKVFLHFSRKLLWKLPYQLVREAEWRGRSPLSSTLLLPTIQMEQWMDQEEWHLRMGTALGSERKFKTKLNLHQDNP